MVKVNAVFLLVSCETVPNRPDAFCCFTEVAQRVSKHKKYFIMILLLFISSSVKRVWLRVRLPLTVNLVSRL